MQLQLQLKAGSPEQPRDFAYAKIVVASAAAVAVDELVVAAFAAAEVGIAVAAAVGNFLV